MSHVLQLDPALTTEVSALRRALLAQVGVREFSGDSEFVDPCLSFVLRDVICTYCNTCRDLDLLRDMDLTGPETDRWKCLHCKTALDTLVVETRLLAEAEQLSTAFLLQDFRCSQTHRVSTKLCAATSELSSALAMDIPHEVFRKDLDVLLRIAEFHKFELLESCVKELLGYE